MKKIIVTWLSFFIFILCVGISTANADDITLSNTEAGYIESDYYVTDTNIATEEDNCTIAEGTYVICVPEGTTTLSSGFTVEKGAVFGVFPGTPDEADIPEDFNFDADGLPDYWEIAYFSSIDYDETDDSDDDGITNAYELKFDTNPSDSTSKVELIYEYDALGRIITNIKNN